MAMLRLQLTSKVYCSRQPMWRWGATALMAKRGSLLPPAIRWPVPDDDGDGDGGADWSAVGVGVVGADGADETVDAAAVAAADGVGCVAVDEFAAAAAAAYVRPGATAESPSWPPAVVASAAASVVAGSVGVDRMLHPGPAPSRQRRTKTPAPSDCDRDRDWERVRRGSHSRPWATPAAADCCWAAADSCCCC